MWSSSVSEASFPLCLLMQSFFFSLLLPITAMLCALSSHQWPGLHPSWGGTKWHLVCRDAKDELGIMSRPGFAPTAQRWAPLELASPRLASGARSQTEREDAADLGSPAGQIMRNSGISSGSLSHLHSHRMERVWNFRAERHHTSLE